MADTESAQIEAQLRELRTQFRDKALDVIRNKLPQKVVALQALFSKDQRFNYTPQQLADRYKAILSPVAASYFAGQPQTNHQDSQPRKKRKLEKEQDEPATTAPVIVIPCNQDIMEAQKELKKEFLELIESANTIKIWIQLNIPRIEDGNNFGVDIQEETIAELGRAEDSAFSGLEDITKYHLARGKLITKCQKHAQIADYRLALIALDYKEYLDTRMAMLDLRNNYAVLHDLITKNLDKIQTPRSSNHMEHLF